MAFQPISLSSTAVTAAEAARLRRDRVDPVEAYARAQANVRAVLSAQAAVVQFGAQALTLARSAETSNPDATAPDLFDILDLELGLFAYEGPSPVESGFFRSANATNTESFLAPQSLDDSLESTFPRASANDTRESSANTTRESSLAPHSDAIFPEAPVDNDSQTASARAPVADHTDAGLFRTPYEVGPNGQRYIVAAEVPLDVTPVPGDPAATLRKMEMIIRAATSGSPSISDRTAAAEAEQLARRARAQLAAERYAKAQEF